MSASGGGDLDPIREVRRVHLALEDWLVGIRQDAQPIETALAPGFVAIDIHGELSAGTEWLDRLQSQYGTGAGVSIELSNLEHRRELYGLHLVTYEKALHVGEASERIMGSVWLRETDRVETTGLQWLHLQETPIPPPTDPDGDEDDA